MVAPERVCDTFTCSLPSAETRWVARVCITRPSAAVALPMTPSGSPLEQIGQPSNAPETTDGASQLLSAAVGQHGATRLTEAQRTTMRPTSSVHAASASGYFGTSGVLRDS